MERAELRGLRFEPEMIGAPFDRAHFIGIAEGDVERGPDREEEIPADRTVEDQHHFPRDGEFRLHFLDDLGGIGRGKPIEEDEEVDRSEEHTSELQSLMRISYAVFCLKKKKISNKNKM